VLLLGTSVYAASADVLRVDGLGTVRLGISLARAERALGSRLGRMPAANGGADAPSEPCWLATRADGRDPGIAYMVERGMITRIDVYVPRAGATPPVKTAKGIGIGSPEGDIQRAYGRTISIEPHPLSATSRWALVERSKRGGIRLEIVDGRVASLWAARAPALDYTEACS